MPDIEFKGKWHVYAHHLTVPFRPLAPDPAKSAGEPSPDGNLIVHGDNLHGLKALLPRYAGRVRCVYIDPPYNTGNEGWTYNDKLDSPLMREWVKQDAPVDGEDLERHDKWCCMMWPRLQLLKELLADDGVIFISIDDNEQHHLRMLMNEIFGEENFLANIVWQHRYGRSNNAKLFSNQREHIVMYRKTEDVSYIRVKRNGKTNGSYSNPDDDPRGPWTSSSYVNPATKEERPNLVYSILNPNTNEMVDHPTHAWKYSYSTYEEHVKDDRLYWGKDGNYQYPRLKNFLSESEQKGIVPIDLMLADEAGTTDDGTRTLQAIFQSNAVEFNNPKPVELIRKLIEICEGASGGPALVLDSFAGSGTTAQAVLELNREDGGDRKFILVECEDYADSVTAERVRRVIAGVPDARGAALREGFGGSFLYCTLGKPIEVEGMLTDDEALPPFASLAAWLLHTATGVSAETAQLRAMNEDGHFYSDDRRDYYLLYEPSVEWLRSDDAVLDERRALRIGEAVREREREGIVFGAARYISQRDLTVEHDITFCQLPYEIHRLRNGER